MVEIKLYLYDGTRYENKGTDYSQYVLSGSNWTDDLTEVLDTAEVTLVGLPTSDEFAPTTKFIMEIREVDAEQGTNQLYQTLSLCVANDTVTQPILSDNNYFSHSITFNEASVIAQGRVVDNCSETFELKKVDINSESTYDTTANAQPTIAPSYTNDEVKSNYTRTGRRAWNVHETFIIKQKYEWVFTSDYLSQSDPNYGSQNDWDTFKKYQSVNGTLNVSLPIPLLSVKFGVKGSTSYQSNRNLCSVETRVYYSADEGTTWQLDTSVGVNGVLTTKPSTTVPEENAWESDWLFKQVYGSSLQGYGMTRIKAMTGAINEYYRKYTDYDSSVQNRFVNFTVVPNYQYKVIISPRIIPTATLELGDHSDPDLENTKYFYVDTEQMLYTYSYAYLNSALSISLASYTYIANNTNTPITFSSTTSNEGRPSMVMDFSTFVEGTNLSVFLKSAPAISVYDMIKDIILKTQMTFKEEGIYIKDTPTLFDFDENDLNILQNTEIIESSFNQKNLWEVLLEAGKYIHAIPYLEFGYDMKIIIKWRYLGKPDKFENNSHAMSIFNSKSIENYVGALNSYVTNMVQRGGYIEEYVAPKSESEDYLVYNDVAVIKTTKPIIELLSLGFRCVRNGSGYTASSTIYDITNRIYEKNVYELFDVVASTIPNKGLAVYYNLGENVIRGLNYQLPSVNTGSGETEYSIKRIIGTALGMSASNFMNIKINDFVFYVKYRTKETIRSEQSRPDLRKFLKNINYENIPYHNQFNNQQDKMVDSIKFGNQTYGKLIRTGNTEYQTTEWNDRLGDLKQSGQLIDNRGDIYYVSKAVHTFYQDYIISDVTYSKDYNQLSEIVGIPSEPRFFEISEQSNIDRHISIRSEERRVGKECS